MWLIVTIVSIASIPLYWMVSMNNAARKSIRDWKCISRNGGWMCNECGKVYANKKSIHLSNWHLVRDGKGAPNYPLCHPCYVRQ